MKKYVVLAWSVLYSVLSFSSDNQIIVESSEYKNKTIVFYRFTDYITQNTDTLAVVQTDANGALSLTISTDSWTEVFIDLDRYNGVLMISPEKTRYELLFPNYTPKNKAEELNVFFKPKVIRLIVKNEQPNDINKLLNSFDNIFDEFLIQKFDSIYQLNGVDIICQFETRMNEYYEEVDNSFFTDYRRYKIALLKYLGPNRSFKAITKRVLNYQNIAYRNPAYMELFNLMFERFFEVYKGSFKGKDLDNVVRYSRSPIKFSKMLNDDFLPNDTLARLIMLKGIHDECLLSKSIQDKKESLNKQCLIMLDSVVNFGISFDNRQIAKNIFDKIKHQESTSIDAFSGFELEDIHGTTVKLKDFAGKYVYLNIVQTDIFPAMEAMDRLKGIYNKYRDELEVVSIFTDKDRKHLLNIDTDDYPWTLLHIGDNSQLLKQLRFVVWPQFHLVDPYGKLILSPAPAPNEDFERRWIEILDGRS